jgi:hypothetical protein
VSALDVVDAFLASLDVVGALLAVGVVGASLGPLLAPWLAPGPPPLKYGEIYITEVKKATNCCICAAHAWI